MSGFGERLRVFLDRRAHRKRPIARYWISCCVSRYADTASVPDRPCSYWAVGSDWGVVLSVCGGYGFPFIDHAEALELVPVGAPIEDEIVGPDLIRARRRLRSGSAPREARWLAGAARYGLVFRRPMSASGSTETPQAQGADSPIAKPASARLLVIMPALNEEELIGGVIRQIPREIPGIERVDVLVIDDGSTDGTVSVATEAGASIVSLHANMGLGIAMQRGIDEAVRRGVDYAVNIDSDGQFNPADIPRLLQPLIDGTADMVSASRFKDRSLVPEMPLVKRVGNWGMSKIVSWICGQEFADVSCGFRAYTRETMLQLVLSGSFTYTQESFILLAQRNLRIKEVPLKVRGVREKGKSRIASNLFRYAYRTVGIMYSCVRDFSPASVFNAVTSTLMALSAGFAAFFVWHRISSGQFSPHIWAGFLAAFVFGIALVTFWMGQVAEMIARQRSLQERQLYLLRKYLERTGPGA